MPDVLAPELVESFADDDADPDAGSPFGYSEEPGGVFAPLLNGSSEDVELDVLLLVSVEVLCAGVLVVSLWSVVDVVVADVPAVSVPVLGVAVETSCVGVGVGVGVTVGS